MIIWRVFRNELPLADRGPANQIGVAAKILRRAVQSQVKAQLDRFLQHGRAEGAVHQRHQLVAARQCGRLAQIHHTQRRVRGRFHIQRFCAAGDESLDAFEVRLDVLHANSQPRKHIPE